MGNDRRLHRLELRQQFVANDRSGKAQVVVALIDERQRRDPVLRVGEKREDQASLDRKQRSEQLHRWRESGVLKRTHSGHSRQTTRSSPTEQSL